VFSFLSLSELKGLLRSQGVDYLTDQQLNDLVSSSVTPAPRNQPIQYSASTSTQLPIVLLFQALSMDPASPTSAGVGFPAFFRMMTSTPLIK
jgi:hypothetical protein